MLFDDPTRWSVRPARTKASAPVRPASSFTIAPNTPGEPEAGLSQAVFIKKNADFGNTSPEYPVTLS
jgi:hypothetical protein